MSNTSKARTSRKPTGKSHCNISERTLFFKICCDPSPNNLCVCFDRFAEHKELLVFFPDDYSAVKMSRNKVLGTAQQLSELKANTWADVDVGESQAWKGLIIKTGE